MTIVCAYTDGDRVWMAADTQNNQGHLIVPQPSRKLRQIGSWVIGISGMPRIAEFCETGSDRNWSSICDIRDGLTGWLQSLGAIPYEGDEYKGGIPSFCYDLLAARGNDLYEINCDGTIDRIDEFAAIGEGREIGYGVFHALKKVHSHQPAFIVRTAVEAAIRFCSGCGGEIDLIEVPKLS